MKLIKSVTYIITTYMRYFIFLLLFVVACSSKSMFNYSVVEPKEAFKILIDSSSVKFIDLRTSAEYGLKHIDGALNIDFYSIDFMSMVEGLNREDKYILYGRNSDRSKKAMNVFKELGFKYVSYMDGGLNSWDEVGLPYKR